MHGIAKFIMLMAGGCNDTSLVTTQMVDKQCLLLRANLTADTVQLRNFSANIKAVT